MSHDPPAPVPLSTLGWGSGGRRALLLHGIGSNAAGWWRVGADLAEWGWTVIAPDLRGHGYSPDGPRYTLADFAGDVLTLGVGWDAVLGHSMGGAVAVLAQARDPEFSRRLLLQDPAILMPEPKEDLIGWLVEVYDRPLTPEQLAADNPGWHLRDAEARAAALQRAGPDLIVAIVEQSWPWNVLADLTAVTVPTVILGSDPTTGGIFPVTLGRWLEDAHPLIQYRMLGSAPHSAHRYGDAYHGYLLEVLDALGWAPTLREANEEGR